MSRWDLDFDDVPKVAKVEETVRTQAAVALVEDLGLEAPSLPAAPSVPAPVSVQTPVRPVVSEAPVFASQAEIAAMLNCLDDNAALVWQHRVRREGVTERNVAELRGVVERQTERREREARQLAEQEAHRAEFLEREERAAAQRLVSKIKARKAMVLAESQALVKREAAMAVTRKAVKAQGSLTAREVHAVRLALSKGTTVALSKVAEKLGEEKVRQARALLASEFAAPVQSEASAEAAMDEESRQTGLFCF